MSVTPSSVPHSRRSRQGGGGGPPIPPGAVFKEEGAVPPMPLGGAHAIVRVLQGGAHGSTPDPLPLDAVVKEEHEVVVKEEDRSDDRRKRRRNK